MNEVIVAIILFFAVLMKSLTGFGLALISMPLLVDRLGIQVAAPLVALVGITSQVVLLLYYQRSFSLRALLPLMAGSIIGIPLGVLALGYIDENVMSSLLGIVVISYAAYAFTSPQFPRLKAIGLKYSIGIISGLLTGAYNSGGPPLIMYADAERWKRGEFKGNLQGIFIVHSITVILAHAMSGNYTERVWHGFLAVTPAIFLGTVLGLKLYTYVDQQLFRKLVLILLMVLGLRLLV